MVHLLQRLCGVGAPVLIHSHTIGLPQELGTEGWAIPRTASSNLAGSAITSCSLTTVRSVQQLSVDSLTANCRLHLVSSTARRRLLLRRLLQPRGPQGAGHRRPSPMDEPPVRCCPVNILTAACGATSATGLKMSIHVPEMYVLGNVAL